MIRLCFAIWSCKWGVARLAVAGGILWVLVADNPSRLARVQFSSLPQMDYLGEARSLRAEHRYAEALLVCDAGLEQVEGEAHAALESERRATRDEQESVLRRGKELLRGALVGEGDSIEALIGAIAADMLVLGDVRDLVIQGGRLAVDGETDELVLALSAAGVLTTVLPEIDWIAAVLKVAKKAGSLSRRMIEALVRIVRRANDTRDYAELRRLFGHFKTLFEKATPAGALRLLRHLDDPKEIEAVAGFLKREPAGGFVLHVAGKDGVELLKTSVRESEQVLVLAARKGDRGIAWLRTGAQRLFRPHPLIGLAKGLHKGTVPELVMRVADEYDPRGWFVIPACAAWAFLEAAWLWRRLGARAYILRRAPSLAEVA